MLGRSGAAIDRSRCGNGGARTPMISPTKRLLMAMTIATAISIGAEPTSAQKFLRYGRLICPGNVAVETADARQKPIRTYQNVFARVANHQINWFCDGQAKPAYECPANTNVVQIDRRHPGPVFTITCFQR